MLGGAYAEAVRVRELEDALSVSPEELCRACMGDGGVRCVEMNDPSNRVM